jgi:protease IV
MENQMAENQPTNPGQQKAPPPPPPQYYHMQKKKSNWWIPVVVILGVIVLFFVMIGVFISMVGSSFDSEPYEVKDNSVLYLNLAGNIPEYVKDDIGSMFSGKKSRASFFETLNVILKAKEDPRIKGIYIKSFNSGMGFAKAAELQDAIADFKESGKFVYAYMDYGSDADYFNCLPADKIIIPDEAFLELNGFGISTFFMKDMFAKLGIDYHVLGFEDFKSAGDMFSRTNFSDSARYQLRVLLDQRLEVLANSIAKFRKMNSQTVHEMLNEGIFSADSLLKYGFIDNMASKEQVYHMMKQEVYGEDYDKKSDEESILSNEHKIRLVTPANYFGNAPKLKGDMAPRDERIAIINFVGAIQDRGDNGPFNDTYVITPGEFIKYIKDAREDDDIKVIIIRINSPGGSAMASSEIWEEIMKTRDVKPIYASMSDVAASGGYYIPMACDTIIAHPSTITGSIGVVMAIPNFSGVMDNIYVRTDTISTGKSSQFLNLFYPMTDGDKQKLYTIGKSIYDRFLNKVGEARGMTYDEVRVLARGRVWTGKDAKERGLVDMLGGLYDAIDLAKARMGYDSDKKVYIETYPRSQEGIVELLKAFGLDEGNDDQVHLESDTKTKMAKMLGIETNILKATYESLPIEMQKEFDYQLQLIEMTKSEKVIMAMPTTIEIK